ncbi:hypothetical protein ODJ79_19665 [Actinoplanes sp. KI2]|uniref:hypothetical protein n=1 Tax=Actinoplanes sp. KI2 TaxID=2983315 RepID=UPI0021D5A65C|nr:hypothetical protein [Actinoplanes sp. KI2]MCU7725950.1 hypothetical protein [Actinoplanes sp. KI2]
MTNSLTSVPDTAFLQPGDMPGPIKGSPLRLAMGEQPLPSFCGAAYDQHDRIAVRATFRLLYNSPGSAAESTPKAEVYEDILVYREDAATVFLTALRAAVAGCASQTDDVGVRVVNVLRGAVEAGDESALIEQRRAATDEMGEPLGDGSEQSMFWAAIRVANAIAFLTVMGWETASADLGDTITLGQRAADRLAAWRAHG